MSRHVPRIAGFTLVELLVSVSVIAILLSILIPSINAGRRSARLVACQANLRTAGQLIQTYALQNDDRIPRGPSHEPISSANQFISAFLATNVVWLGDPYTASKDPAYVDAGGQAQLRKPQYIGLGLLQKQPGKAGNEFMYCPADSRLNVDQETTKIGQKTANTDAFTLVARGSYFYRQMDMTAPEVRLDGRLDDLRSNYGTSLSTAQPDSGQPFKVEVAALALDANYLQDGAQAEDQPHQGQKVNVVYLDSSVQSFDNDLQQVSSTESAPWATVPTAAFAPDGMPLFAQLSRSLDRILLAADYSYRADPAVAPVPPYPLYP